MHDLSLFLSLAVLQTFPANITPAESADYRFLQALALVESGANPKATGDGNRAVGAWQMHFAAWIDANNWLRSKGRKTLDRSRWREPSVQREVAYAYLQVCKERLAGGGYEVTPRNIAFVWNMGYANFDDMNKRGKTPNERRLDYAIRVETIFTNGK